MLSGLPRPRPSPRSRGAVGVADVAGERGERAPRLPTPVVECLRGLWTACRFSTQDVEVVFAADTPVTPPPYHGLAGAEESARLWLLGCGIRCASTLREFIDPRRLRVLVSVHHARAWQGQRRRNRGQVRPPPLDDASRKGDPVRGLLRLGRGPRSRGAVGVAGVAGERGVGSSLSLDAWNRRDLELTSCALSDPPAVEFVNSPTAVEPGTRRGFDEGTAVLRAQWEILLDGRQEIDRT